MRALWEAHGACGLRLRELALVPALRGYERVDGAEDVLLEQLRELASGGGAVVGLDRVADVDLVVEQHLLLGREVRQVADDPRFLSRSAARKMMNIHLKQVIQQGVDELKGHYAADARAFGPYIRHILDMADMISGGIIRQFRASSAEQVRRATVGPSARLGDRSMALTLQKGLFEQQAR
jgi:hypothetical protein